MIDTFLLMDPATILMFIGAGILLNLTPGADVMFATASGLTGGARAGIAAAGGISLGSLVHTGLAALGVSAVIAANPLAYDAIRWAGAAYLLHLAVRTWRAVSPPEDVRGEKRLMTAVSRGFLTSLLNPKVALFILAFLPQFADPAAGPIWQQIVILGLIFSINGMVITAGFGAVAGLFRTRVAGLATGFNKISALVFGGLAIRLLWE